MKSHHYRHLVCGGTFDHLHPGHRYFLKTAMSLAETVTIGLTDFGTYQKPYPGSIQSYASRKNTLANYLSSCGKNAKIVPITDRYGPSIHNDRYDSILVTKQTREGANDINRRRKLSRLKPLKIISCDLAAGYSSTAIRAGLSIKKGQTFLKQSFLRKGGYFLPAGHRIHFQKPLGQLIVSPHSLSWPKIRITQLVRLYQPPLVAVVGDVAVHSFGLNRVPFDLAIIDHKTRRQPLTTAIHRQIFCQARTVAEAVSPPGTISAELIVKTASTIDRPGLKIITIAGEEDLAVMPLILFAPLNSLIFYGQPDQGLVAVRVTLAKKQECLNLLKYFY